MKKEKKNSKKYIFNIVKYFLLFLAITTFSCNKFKDKSKALWIKNTFETLKTNNYPKIKAIAWWHDNFDKSKLRIDSSPESLKAYQEGVASTLFISSLKIINNKLKAPSTGIYHAAIPDFDGTEDVVSKAKIKEFETLAKKDIAWVYFSNNWFHKIAFPSSRVETIRNTGKTPFIRMMPRTDYEQNGADENYSMQQIIDGDLDIALKKWAIDAKNTNIPLLVEFGTEVNGDWFSWNGKFNGAGNKTGYGDPKLADGPERFQDAYRHIIDICNENGADNITWFFHVNYNSSPEKDWNKIENYYPGDDYIDWFGVSIYGPQTIQEDYQEFEESLKLVYPILTKLSDKPIAVLEFGCTEF